MKKRTVSDILPESVAKFWDEWQLRVFVLVSLFLQIMLVLLGNRRRYMPGDLLRFILWLAYSPADQIAEISIGILSNYLGDGEDNPSQQIQAFWAPFLLLHLGGPDTITAYSLDDNALWTRHFLGLLMHSGGAVYIFLRSWKGTSLNILSILMYVAGLIKYGERTWYLISTSTNYFRKSMIRMIRRLSDEVPSDEGPGDGEASDAGPGDGGPSEEEPCDEDEGLKFSYAPCGCASSRCFVPCRPGSERPEVVISVIRLGYAPCGCASSRCCVPCQPGSRQSEEEIPVNTPSSPVHRSKPFEDPLQTADKFFPKFKRLFTDIIFKWKDLEESKSFFRNTSWDRAFEVNEIELGFAYDMFHTKAMEADQIWGGLRRFVCLCYIISTFMGFLIIDKHDYSTSDVIITLLLLVGAILVEIYSIILLCSSDRTMSWLSKQEKTRWKVICEAISSCRVPFLFPENKRWSDSMAQYSLISDSLKNLPIKCSEDWNFCISEDLNFCTSMLENFSEVWNCISQMLECYSNNLNVVPKEVKTLIFEQLQEKSKSASNFKAAKQFCARRGDWTLEKMNCFSELGWSIEGEFDQGILLWHLATDLCYYTDQNKISSCDEKNRKASKLLSDYMVHLLVKRPLMLPDGIGQIRFQDSCAEARELFRSGKHVEDRTEACEKLLQMYTENQPLEVKGYRRKSVLSDACKLAKSLQSLEKEKEWGYEKKWKIMSHVWVEMLFYAACHCPRNQHANELRLGGELLTHVWLLMAHFGITEHLCEDYAGCELGMLMTKRLGGFSPFPWKFLFSQKWFSILSCKRVSTEVVRVPPLLDLL